MNYMNERRGSFLEKKCRLYSLATASPVRQVLYWLRRRLKLIENESEITESLQLQLCSDSPISMIMHAAQSRYYFMETSACLISELHHAQLQDIAHRRTESSKLKVEETTF